jgi:hypothetical protein
MKRIFFFYKLYGYPPRLVTNLEAPWGSGPRGPWAVPQGSAYILGNGIDSPFTSPSMQKPDFCNLKSKALCIDLKTSAILYEVEAIRMIPMSAPLFSGFTLPLWPLHI